MSRQYLTIQQQQSARLEQVRTQNQHLVHIIEQEDGQSLQKRRNTSYQKTVGRKLRVDTFAEFATPTPAVTTTGD